MLLKVHVFPFSLRPGTLAAKIKNQTSPLVMHEREIRMLSISEHEAVAHKQKFLGEIMKFSSKQSKNHEGFTDNYLRVRIESDNLFAVNEIVDVKIQKADSKFLYGIPV